MVKIRLRRTGAKKQPYYRVVVTDSRSPRDGKFLEIIGNYNPRTEPPTMEIDAERALYWLSVGAQPSEAVKRMLDKMGIMAQVPAARKGTKSLDEILADLELTKAAKATLKEEPAKKAPAAKAAKEEIEEIEDEAEAFDDEDVDAEFEDDEDYDDLEGDEADDVDDDWAAEDDEE
jgi:small subunit ribosomal protein S16